MAQSFIVGANATSDKVGSACVYPCMCMCMCMCIIYIKPLNHGMCWSIHHYLHHLPPFVNT